MSALRVVERSIERHAGAMPAVTTAVATWRQRRGLVLRVRDQRGRVGCGEASPLPGYSPDDVDRAERALERATRVLPALGDGDELGAIAAAVADVDAAAPSARFCLETALLDLVAQRRGCAVAAVLAPDRAAATVRCTAVVTSAAEAIAAGDRGIGALKLKLGRDWDGELALVRAVRAAAPELPLRVDVNGRWSVARAHQRLLVLAELGVELVEQPVVPQHMAALADSPVPLAADESLHSAAGRAALAPLVAAGTVGAYVLKPAVLGGALACMELAARARAGGVDAIVSHLLDGPIALAACAELACALGGRRAHGLDRHPGLEAWPGADLPQFAADALRSAGPGLLPPQRGGQP